MPTMTRLTLTMACAALLGAAAATANAQHEAGIRLELAAPTGEFGDTVDDPGFGIIAHYAYAMNSRLSLGLGADYVIYGSETRRETLPLVDDFEIETSNNIAGFFLLGQFNLVAHGGVVPYLEGRFGGQYLWTESKLVDADWWDDDDVAEQVNFDDFTLQYGIGGGLKFRVSEGNGKDKPTVFIDAKVMFGQGGEAEYLTEGSIIVDGSTTIFRPSKSQTDLTRFELGAVLTF
ncbi:outer membrane beta-barrel protein [bacterium]|nr:outer membrane beta-barrel protein [bacterium]